MASSAAAAAEMLFNLGNRDGVVHSLRCPFSLLPLWANSDVCSPREKRENEKGFHHPSLSFSLSLSLVICLRLNGGQVNKVSKMGFSFILEWLAVRRRHPVGHSAKKGGYSAVWLQAPRVVSKEN